MAVGYAPYWGWIGSRRGRHGRHHGRHRECDDALGAGRTGRSATGCTARRRRASASAGMPSGCWRRAGRPTRSRNSRSVTPIRLAAGWSPSSAMAPTRWRSSRWAAPPAVGAEARAGLKVAVQAAPAEVGIALANWSWKVVRQFVEDRCGVRLCRSACTGGRRPYLRGRRSARSRRPRLAGVPLARGHDRRRGRLACRRCAAGLAGLGDAPPVTDGPATPPLSRRRTVAPTVASHDQYPASADVRPCPSRPRRSDFPRQSKQTSKATYTGEHPRTMT